MKMKRIEKRLEQTQREDNRGGLSSLCVVV
jgi:hypothetical protein